VRQKLETHLLRICENTIISFSANFNTDQLITLGHCNSTSQSSLVGVEQSKKQNDSAIFLKIAVRIIIQFNHIYFVTKILKNEIKPPTPHSSGIFSQGLETGFYFEPSVLSLVTVGNFVFYGA